MENNEYVAAVDLGTTKVVMAVGRKAEKNKIEIVALKELNSNGVMKGDLKNIEQASQVLREVKNQLEKELGVVVREAYVGVSGQHIQCNRTQGYVTVQNMTDAGVTEVRRSDVERLIDDQRNASLPAGKTIISILPQSYILDGEDDISEPVGMEGRKLEAKFNVIIGEETAIERLRRCFQRVGLNLAGIVLQPLASAEAVLSDDEKELGVAVVDIGGGTTDICVYYDKVIRHLAVIPIGGNIINKDIRAYGILERYVEKLKTSFGEAVAERTPGDKYINIPSVNGQAPKEIAVRTLAGIIEARMYDIIDYVKIEIERCGFKGRLGAGIVLTGGGANLKNLDQLFKLHTGLEVRVAQPTTYVGGESVELISAPKYSTLTGIVLDAVRKGNYTEIGELPSLAGQATGASSSAAADPYLAREPQAPEQSMGGSGYHNNSMGGHASSVPGGGYDEGRDVYDAPQVSQGGQSSLPGGEGVYDPYNEAGGYAEEGYDDDPNGGDYFEDEIQIRKPKMKERLRRWFGSILSEEVDDDDDRY